MATTGAPVILYVDDDPDDLTLVQETLMAIQPSITVKCYISGSQALPFLDSIPVGAPLPGVVILDLNLPNQNGIDILNLLKQNELYKNIPVYIFTNSDHPRHRQQALSAGAIDFITKPYDGKGLMEACTIFAGYANGPVIPKGY